MNDAIEHKSGFVALAGRSNVGKSTLLNRLVGQKVAIVTPKPQTTRRRILGIRNDDDSQIVFIDSPGMHESSRLMNRRMLDVARKSMSEGDLVIGLVEARERLAAADREFLAEMTKLKRRKIAVINKIDLFAREQLLPLISQCAELLPDTEIVPVSARTGDNVAELLRVIKSMLRAGPALMSTDEYTDQTERMIAAEIVREKLFLRLEHEVPFSTAVQIENFVQDKDLARISAVIIVERDSHKGIVIGAKGAMLKQIGTAARLELEEILGCRVFLEMFVKVEHDWTINPRRLQELGL